MDDSAILLIGLILCAIVALPFLGLAAFIRVRRLEREVAALRAYVGTHVADGAIPAPASSVASIPAASQALAPSLPTSRPAAPRHDLETVVAGRWLTVVGLVAVTLGVSYFLKYAIDSAWIGPAGQVALGIAAGVTLVASSLPLLKRGHVYFADALTGLGGVVIYLSLWASVSYYDLLPIGLGFAAMAAATAALLAIAVGRDSQRIAVVAMIGGFLTPMLVSTGQGDPVTLFSYLVVLLAGLLPLARLRDWRGLEIPSLLITQLYLGAWFGTSYGPERLVLTLTFSTAFFAGFAVLPLVRSWKFTGLAKEHVFLVLWNVGGFAATLHATLWPEHRWWLTIAALAIAAFQLAAMRAVRQGAAQSTAVRLLFASIALMALTLAIAIRLDGGWIAVCWAVESALLVWIGLRTASPFMRYAAYILMVIVGVGLTADPPPAEAFLVNARFASAAALVGAAGLSLWWTSRTPSAITTHEHSVLRLFGFVIHLMALWALSLEVELYFRSPNGYSQQRESYFARDLTLSLLWVVYAVGLLLVGVRHKVQGLRLLGLGLLGVTTLKVFAYDLAALRGFYRIVSIIVLGAVLLIVSFLYQRKVDAARSKDPE